MARYKYYSDEDSEWNSPSPVDNSTDDPTYESPRTVQQKKKVLRKNAIGRRNRQPCPLAGLASTSQGIRSNSESSQEEDNEERSDSESSLDMSRKVAEFENQRKKKSAKRQTLGISKEPFSIGIADLPESFCWTDQPFPERPDYFQPVRQPGSVVDGDELPVELFLKMHRPALELLLKAINETGEELVQAKKMARFKPVDWSELLRFHAIFIFCQVVKITRWEFYWNKRSPLYQPFIARQMSFKRFKQLKRCVRCYVPSEVKEKGLDDPKSNSYDPLYKITPMQNVLLQSYRENRNPKREVTIDEQMIKFKVRMLNHLES